MSLYKRLGSLIALSLVLTAALFTGLFLMACQRLMPTGRPPAKPADTAPSTGTRPATTTSKPATTRTVDVPETQQGQPVPNNLLE